MLTVLLRKVKRIMFFYGLCADIRFSYTNKEPDENKTVANSTCVSDFCLVSQECLARHCRFIAKNEWPPNSPDLNLLDYHVWDALSEAVYRQRREKFASTVELKAVSWRLGKRYCWAPPGRVSTNGSRDSAPWSRQTAAPSVTFLNKRLAKKCVFTCHDLIVCSFENKQSNVLKFTHFTANWVSNTHAKIQACNLHTYCKILHWSWGRFLGPPGIYVYEFSSQQNICNFYQEIDTSHSSQTCFLETWREWAKWHYRYTVSRPCRLVQKVFSSEKTTCRQ